MKKKLTYGFILSGMLVFLFASCSNETSTDVPFNLRCYDKPQPVGTDDKPFFGWYFNDPDNNEIQSAYQLIVASSQSNIDKDRGDMYNSGKVPSRKQNFVYYEGKPLNPATRYFWKVKTWDKNGNESNYADAAIFETGLFRASDWEGANWIKRDTDEADDYTYYRKTVGLKNQNIKRAMIYITACHEYDLYINEIQVGKGPAFHYPQYQYYNAFDVTDIVRQEKNALIACMVHWYGGGQGRPKGARGLLAKMMVEYQDGTTDIVGTDKTWKQTRVEAWLPIVERRGGEGVGYIDHIDASKITSNWNTMGFDDSAWDHALEIGSHPTEPWVGELQPDLTRLIEDIIPPKKVTKLAEGKYIIDLGKVYAGSFKIKFSGGEPGTEIKMMGGYTLNDDGTVNLATNQNCNLSFYFIHDGSEAVFHPFVYFGMRYLQVDNAPGELTVDDVAFVKRHFEVDLSRSSFESSNEMLNKVWTLMKRTIAIGSQEGFVDTPTREKGGFLGDAWSQGVPAMWVTGDRLMNTRVLLEFLDSQDQYWPDGRLNAVYPNGDGKRDIPDYTQQFILWVWDYYMHTGNLQFLEDNYAKIKKVADYVNAHKNEQTGLIHNLSGGSGPYEFGIIDWPAHMRYGYDVETVSRTVIDAYAYRNFQVLSDIAELLGNNDDAQQYAALAEEMKTAINSGLMNEDGIYIDGLKEDLSKSGHASQHANMFPLAMDIVPAENRQKVIEVVKDKKMSVGMVTVRMLPEALGKADEAEHMLELYTNTEWDGWAKTVALGGTATWECWDAPFVNQSLSHPWGEVGVLGIQNYVLGVTVLEPQHDKIQIKPLDFGGKLTSAEGILPSDKGDIYIDWKRLDAQYVLKIEIPDNVVAKVYVPKGENTSDVISINGETKQATPEGRYLFIDNIGSGNYELVREF